VPRRVFSRAYGLLAVLAVAQACNSSFTFDVPPAAGTAGTAGTLPEAGVVSAAGVSSSGGSDGGGVGAGGGGSGGSGAGSGSSGAGGASAGSGGTPATDDACGALAACPAPLHCAGAVCVQCVEDVDCEPYNLARCDPTRHRCVACIETADCQMGFSCDALANRCLQQCMADVDCRGSADGCDGLRRVCYKCDENEACLNSPLGHVCASDGSGCVQCGKNGDCPGQVCDQLTGRCVDCRDADGCPSGLCNPMTGTCINP
jgi:hypothetical protein